MHFSMFDGDGNLGLDDSRVAALRGSTTPSQLFSPNFFDIAGYIQAALGGKLRHFPSPFGASGAFGSSNSGFIQNGYSVRWNLLSRAIVLQSEDKFSFVVQPIVPTWTPTISFNITIELIGKVIKTFVP